MHSLPRLFSRRTVLVSLLSLTCAALATARALAAEELTGRLIDVDGVRVLQVWGTPHERGYAHGYLLAEEIVEHSDAYVRELFQSREQLAAFDNKTRAQVQAMNIPPRYAAELRGILTGIRARLGDRARLDAFDRPFDLTDLVVTNCLPELMCVGCSSFAAWGPLTKDGGTISGRNLDWHRLDSLRGSQLIIAYEAYKPDDGEGHDALGWVSVTWPGFIGCLTGMNAEGVTVSMHDAPGAPPSAVQGFTPRALALRHAVEAARANSAVEDVRRVLSAHLSLVGNNVPISFPSSGKSAAAIFEYDGDRNNGSGLTIRRAARSSIANKKNPAPGASASYLVCTNHYRERAMPETCRRYAILDTRLTELAREGKPVDLKEAWNLLRGVAVKPRPGQQLETYQSVIFEPNKRVMHVAFSTEEMSAADNKPVLLRIDQLLEQPETAVRR